MTQGSSTREELKDKFGELIRFRIDLVCGRNGIDLDEDQRAEIACVAACDIAGFLDDVEKQREGVGRQRQTPHRAGAVPRREPTRSRRRTRHA